MAVKLVLFLLASISPVFGDLYDDAAIFMKCKGKSSGLTSFFDEKTALMAPCLTYRGKYCRIACLIEKFELTDEETGEFNVDELNKLVRRYGTQMDSKTKETMLNGVKTCTKGEKYAIKGKCDSTRKAFYCLHNIYIKACDINKPPKNLEKFSDETGAVQDAVSTSVKLVTHEVTND